MGTFTEESQIFKNYFFVKKKTIKCYETALYTPMNSSFSDMKYCVFCLNIDSEAGLLGFSARSDHMICMWVSYPK